ncbi:hypothetical protein G9A89_006860 [Geosiphon pyriformis]|nr:hypothetical protein G9A89_006860 [Geosiphon pyriformis]
MNKFDGFWMFISGLDFGHMGSGIVIVMNISLARHVCKVSEVPGQLLFIKLLFKNKLSVSILGLYAGASLAGEVNFFIAKTVNEYSFIILGGNFNKDSLCKSASFKRCLNLGLVNFLSVLSNLVNAVVDHNVVDVSKHFNTNHWAVSVSVDLGSLLDTQLNFFCKQANRNYWRFDFRSADDTNAGMFANKFATTIQLLDLDVMWNFKDFDGVFTRDFSRFHKLELLMSKLVKASCLVSSVEFASLLDTWCRINANSASVVKSLFLSGSNFDMIHLALAKMRKSYCFSKLLEFRCAKKACIKAAINKKMESFKSDKGYTIRSVLEHLFHKVVLNYLVISDKLVLEPSLVKSRVNGIMKGWTRKHRFCQYWPLEYVFDDAFFGIMCSVGVDELLGVKHCDKSVLDMLLVLLNFCLICKSVPSAWKETWILIIPKPYEWNEVLMNTQPIALIETACKILSKILSNKILLACSTFDVLCRNNFLVLRSMTIQSPIFAVGSVNMRKAYDSVGWEHLQNSLVRIKMYSRFIRFFGNIHNDCINRVMTDFGLIDGYRCIFYDPLLCKVKRQADGCEYRLNSYFISGCGHAKSWAGLSSFFTAGAFHILNVASKFFDINDISINNNKTVVIPINYKVADSSLLISGSPISIAKRGESHHYLGIYLSTKGFSKPSLAKTHSNVWFFANLVLKKAVSDKQFSYLVSAVLFPIIGYRTQFSYVLDLKSKSGLPYDFPSNVIHHLALYGLKTFKQIQAENKSALYLVHVKVNLLNNFLAGMVLIFSGSNLFLGGSLTNAFCYQNKTPMSCVLGETTYFKFFSLLWHYGIAFFEFSVQFLGGASSFSVYSLSLDDSSSSNILCSSGFNAIRTNLLCFDVDCLSVYMDGFLSGLGSVDMKAGTAVFFENIGIGLGVEVSGLMSSTLTELQAIALALKYISPFCSINLFLDNLVHPDFRNQCWIERCHIVNVIHRKNLNINWYKVKGHLGVLGNECTDKLARAVGGAAISVYRAHWEIGFGLQVMVNSLCMDIDWFKSLLIWHLDSHMAAGFTSNYPSVMHLFCDDVEVLDHAFFCLFDANNHAHLLDFHASAWGLLLTCSSDILVSIALCKSFVFKNWFHESVSVFKDSKVVSQNIVTFVCEFSHAFWEDIWLVRAKHHAFMEKNGLIPHDRSVPVLISGLFSVLSVSVIGLLDIAKTIGIVSVHIDV